MHNYRMYGLVALNADSIIAIAVLNHEDGLRPFLAKWHPLLAGWEAQRRPEVDPRQHEKDWEYGPTLRGEMDGLRKRLTEYAEALAEIAGVTH